MELDTLRLSPISLPVLATAALLFLAIKRGRGREIMPFLFTTGPSLLGLPGLAMSLWPDLVPQDSSVDDAAAPRSSQVFLLIGVSIPRPVLLRCVGFIDRISCGEVGEDAGYD